MQGRASLAKQQSTTLICPVRRPSDHKHKDGLDQTSTRGGTAPCRDSTISARAPLMSARGTRLLPSTLPPTRARCRRCDAPSRCRESAAAVLGARARDARRPFVWRACCLGVQRHWHDTSTTTILFLPVCRSATTTPTPTEHLHLHTHRPHTAGPARFACVVSP